MQLTRARIITTAMALIEAEGVEAVSMPRLAAELGCGLLALYSLVPSRHSLLDAIADAIAAAAGPVIAAGPASAPGADWPEQLRSQARAARAAARTHPRCALIAASRPASSAQAARPAESMLTTLRAAGLGRQDAVRALRALTAFSAGALLCETGIAPGLHGPDAGGPPRLRLRAADFPLTTDLAAELSAVDPDADFELGLDLLVRAIAMLAVVPAGTGGDRASAG